MAYMSSHVSTAVIVQTVAFRIVTLRNLAGGCKIFRGTCSSQIIGAYLHEWLTVDYINMAKIAVFYVAKCRNNVATFEHILTEKVTCVAV
jgi:hypothetical protein